MAAATLTTTSVRRTTLTAVQNRVSRCQVSGPVRRSALVAKCSSADSERFNFRERVASAAAAAVLAGTFLCEPAGAELNKFEYQAGGEFGNGTALQYGSADESGSNFKDQVRRIWTLLYRLCRSGAEKASSVRSQKSIRRLDVFHCRARHTDFCAQ